MLQKIETFIRRQRRNFSRTALLVKLFSLGLPETSAGETVQKSTDSQAEQKQTEFKNGLVMVQIDGLGKHELERALARGEMPFLSSLINSEHYRLRLLYSGLPSSTPSVQGELFYGVKTAVPAFAFVDTKTDEVFRMYDPECAMKIEAQLQEQGQPLLAGGSAYCDIYTGGAMESHFCAASLGWSTRFKGVHPVAWSVVAMLYLPMLVRTCLRVMLECGFAIHDLVRGWVSGFDIRSEFKFVFSRVAISVLLRDLITIGACVDITRGLPIIHLNYLGYDEQAHRRGPQSAFAHWSLKGIDRSIQKLWAECHRSSDRHYDLWIYSDHGQEATTPYESLTGTVLADAVSGVINTLAAHLDIKVLSLNERIDQRRANLLGGRWLQKLFPTPHQVSIAHNFSASSVIAMGPLGHVYLDGEVQGAVALKHIANELVSHAQIPAVVYIQNEKVMCQCRSALINLPTEGAILFGDAHPNLTLATQDIIALVRHPNAGQLVVLGWAAGCSPITFPIENGAHAGIGPRETAAFALLPEEHLPTVKGAEPLRPLDLHQEALSLLGRLPMKNELNLAVRTTHRAERTKGSLRVMSYNVHSCVGMDGRVAPERIARVISRTRPDIVALQELDVKRNRTGYIDQAGLIAELLDMEYHFYPTIQFEEEAYGDAILTHLPITAVRMASLPSPSCRPGREPRGAVWTTLMVDGTPIQVINTHLGLFPEERLQQVRRLNSEHWLQHPDCLGPTILCGDMNASLRAPAMRVLSKQMNEVQSLLKQAPRKNTFSGRLPLLCIDHVFVRDVKRIHSVEVPNTELTRLASDHLPLIVDMELF